MTLYILTSSIVFRRFRLYWVYQNAEIEDVSILNSALASTATMILFLDFDGVLHPETALSTRADFQHRPLLWRILREVPEVKVVFATSWRNSHTLEELVSLVTTGGGEDLVKRFVGVNPVVDKASREQRDLGHRREECLQWIQENRSQFPYWKKHIPWMALDDVAYWYGLPCFELHLTNYQTGLTEADVEAVIKKMKAALAA